MTNNVVFDYKKIILPDQSSLHQHTRRTHILYLDQWQRP